MFVHGALHETDMPPGEATAVNCVAGAPPSKAGAAKVSVACSMPPLATKFETGPGGVARLLIRAALGTPLTHARTSTGPPGKPANAAASHVNPVSVRSTFGSFVKNVIWP